MRYVSPRRKDGGRDRQASACIEQRVAATLPEVPELYGSGIAPAPFTKGDRAVRRGAHGQAQTLATSFGGDSMKRIAAVLFLITLSVAATAQTNDPQALYKLGRDAVTRGEPEKAVEYFEKLTALKPNNADYHYQLGVAYSLAGMNAGMFGGV